MSEEGDDKDDYSEENDQEEDDNVDNQFEEDENSEDNDGKVVEVGIENKGSSAPKAIPLEERITTKYLTKYEKARIIGARALQISKNAPIFVDFEPSNFDPIKIAEKELQEKKIPFIIRRFLPDNTYEDWKVSELTVE